MKVIVDSNIVFSAILNTKSKIGQLIIDGSKYFDFYTVSLLREEILGHKDKILRYTNYTQKQFNEIYHLVSSRLIFIDDILLNDKDLIRAIDLVKEIEENDALFVALTNHLKLHFGLEINT